MATLDYTPFVEVYAFFLSKITDDMYMELTPQDTYKILRQLLLSALPKFEFPRQNLDYQLKIIQDQEIEEDDSTPSQNEETNENETDPKEQWAFINKLTDEQINIISTYMIVEWLSQQLASVENVRMKYSGSDFKFTSQANHMQKLLQLKKDYEREGFHLQRLYKRRIKNKDGVYRSTLGKIMRKPRPLNLEYNQKGSYDTEI